MMNATELRAENEQLKKALADSQARLVRADDKLKEAQSQHEAVAAQFAETLEEKNRQVASLEHQIKLLLQRIRGSRQERINLVFCQCLEFGPDSGPGLMKMGTGSARSCIFPPTHPLSLAVPIPIFIAFSSPTPARRVKKGSDRS